jgi:hypothetical protein
MSAALPLPIRLRSPSRSSNPMQVEESVRLSDVLYTLLIALEQLQHADHVGGFAELC